MDGGAAVSRVLFTRISGSPPPAQEVLAIEADGSWTAHLVTGTVVGRFAGPAGDGGPGGRIVDLADRAVASEPPAIGNQPLDATIDRVSVDGRSLVTEYRTDPGGPWGDLLGACRALLFDAVANPVAAIAMVVAAPDRLRLEHRGTEPMSVDMNGAEVEGTVWTESGEYLTRGTARLDAGPVEAGPGWHRDVLLEGLDPAKPGNLVAIIGFAIELGGSYVPVTLSAGRAPG